METSSIKYQPKFGRVLIKREVKEKSAGGIIIPDAKRHARCEGIITALGETAGWSKSFDSEGNEKFVQAFNVGDKVIFGRHSGAWLDSNYRFEGGKAVEQDDGQYFICQDEDILAVIKE